MEIRQLEYFRKIAQTGSINEAARQLNMSQPPLSYQLKLLEQELDVVLFERSRQGVTMTEAGKLLYQRSEELLQFADSTKLEVSQIGKCQVLRLGMTSTTVGPILPKISTNLCFSCFSKCQFFVLLKCIYSFDKMLTLY